MKLIYSLSVLVLTACSSGGGGNGTSASTNGVIAVPSATCGTSACLSGSSAFQLSAISSGETVLSYGSDLYTYFNSVTIPAINAQIEQVDQAFASNGIKSCDQAAALPITSNENIGDGYTVDISAGDRAIPAGLYNAAANPARKFVLKYMGTAFANVQIDCSGGYKTIYARATRSGLTFEVWAQVYGTSKTIYGAIDQGSVKRSMYFRSANADTFQLLAVVNGISYGGQTVSAALAGGAKFSANNALISYAGTASQNPTTFSYATNNTNWMGTDIAHCYTNLTSATVEASGATCTSNSLGFVPPANPLRAGAAWTINGMNTAISTTF